MDSDEVRNQWADRTGEYSPEYYAYRGPDDASEAVRHLLDQFVDREAAVLELGCSSGRHLAHLREGGFENLTGIEVNDDAFEVMAETYPELAEDGTFHAAAIEDVVRDFADGQFDGVYSVETLQHVHPDAAWVFDELVRITDKVLVVVENEGGHDPEDTDPSAGTEVNHVDDGLPLYYRDWNQVFTERGLAEVECRSIRRDTVRAFRAGRE